jgi:integrase
VPRITLSDATLRSLAIPQKGQQSYWDASFKAGSFACRVSRGGTKTFVIKYRRRRYTIGQYPTLSLSEARTEARKLLAEFTLGKVRPQSLSYAKAVELFIEEKEKSRRASTAAAYKGLLNRIGLSGPVAEITHQEVRRRLGRINTSGAYNHRLVALKVFFNWCHRNRYITDNPTLGFAKQTRPKKKRVLTDDELTAVWNAAEQTEGHFNTIVKLLMLTGQRRNELAALKGSYYSHNQQTICLPSELAKNHREHLFPIGASCAELLSEILKKPQHVSGYIFFVKTISGSPFSAWSKSKKALDKLATIEPWTLHDLRRTFRTGLARLGVQPQIAERLVNHISARTEMEEVYDEHTYMDEMRDAMNRWEAHLTALIEKKLAA